MNERLDLTQILKDCPKGTKLYSPAFGDVNFIGIIQKPYPYISTTIKTGEFVSFEADGKYANFENVECLLFPSKDQRDWSKFKVSQNIYNFKPYDKVLVRAVGGAYPWSASYFSHIEVLNSKQWYVFGTTKCLADSFEVIPYEGNEYLVGTYKNSMTI